MFCDNDNDNDNDAQPWFAESASDVTLTCQGQKAHARRDLLASESAYFRTTFSRTYFSENESYEMGAP